MSIVRTVDATIEPVTLAEVKTHLHIASDVTAEDSLITSLIKAARYSVENFLRRSLITQTWELRLDKFPATDTLKEDSFTYTPIFLPFPPVQFVTSVQYIDTDGVTQTWDASKYQVDFKDTPARLLPVSGEVYPSVEGDTFNVVTITYVAGWGDNATDVPEDIRSAIKLIIGHLYANRESTSARLMRVLPFGAESLLYPYRDLRWI